MAGSENHHWWYLEEFLRIFVLSEMVDVASPALKSYFLGTDLPISIGTDLQFLNWSPNANFVIFTS